MHKYIQVVVAFHMRSDKNNANSSIRYLFCRWRHRGSAQGTFSKLFSVNKNVVFLSDAAIKKKKLYLINEQCRYYY